MISFSFISCSVVIRRPLEGASIIVVCYYNRSLKILLYKTQPVLIIAVNIDL